MSQVIGILGGMGPRATVAFEQLLVAQFGGTDQDVPTIITINDGSIPDRSRFILGSGPDPVPQLQRNLQLLEQMGAQIICLPCNTASTATIGGRLRTRSARLLNLPELTGHQMVAAGTRQVYLLGTAGTIQAGTYQRICRTRGIGYQLPSPDVQRSVDALIQAVKRHELTRARLTAQALERIIRRSGCDGVLLGCTELPLVGRELVPVGCQAFDTLAILATACVGYSQNLIQGVSV